MKTKETEMCPLEQKIHITLFQSVITVFVVSFLCYSNTLNAQFVYDDNRAILRNQDLRPEKPWLNIFYNDFWGTPLRHSGSHKSYRPLCVLSFRLNYLFGELNSWGYHFVNNILHSIVSCLFTYFCYNIFQEELLVLIGGLLFAVHPIHTEAVAGIVGRADVGAAMFFMVSLISYQLSTFNISNRTSTSINSFYFILTLLSSMLAMYTKELGITVLGVCLAYDVLFVSRIDITSPIQSFKCAGFGALFRYAVLTIFSICMLYGRFLIMGYSPPEFSTADNPAANHPDAMTRFLTFIYLPFCNMWLLLYPWKLSYDWSMNTVPLVESVFTIETLLSFLFYGFLLTVAFIYLYYLKDFHMHGNERNPIGTNIKETTSFRLTDSPNNSTKKLFVYKSLSLMVFSISMMILTFLPATNLFFYVGFVIAERILYIPSIGFSLLMLNGLNVVTKLYPGKRKNVLASTFCIFIMFAAKTYTRNFVWDNEETLYRSGIEISPAKSYANLANILIKQSKLKEAESAYRSALRFRSNMADTHYNLGILLQNQNRYDEAIKCYRDAITYRPRLAAAHLNLGSTLMEMKRYNEALQVFSNAYNISDHGLKDPHMHAVALTNIRYNAGRVLHELRKYEDAINIFMNAIEKMPDGYEPHSIYNMIGQCYALLNDDQSAENWYIKALQSKPNHVPALLAHAKLLASTRDEKKVKEAEDNLNKAITLEPNRTESFIIYAHMLKENHRINEAIQLLKNCNQCEGAIYGLLSDLYRALNDYDSAVIYQTKATEVLAQDAGVWMNLGALYHVLKKYDEAMHAYLKAKVLSPNNDMLNENIKKLKKLMKRK